MGELDLDHHGVPVLGDAESVDTHILIGRHRKLGAMTQMPGIPERLGEHLLFEGLLLAFHRGNRVIYHFQVDVRRQQESKKDLGVSPGRTGTDARRGSCAGELRRTRIEGDVGAAVCLIYATLP